MAPHLLIWAGAVLSRSSSYWLSSEDLCNSYRSVESASTGVRTCRHPSDELQGCSSSASSPSEKVKEIWTQKADVGHVSVHLLMRSLNSSLGILVMW